VLESACEGCCSDEGYFGGFSRGVGLGVRFEIGFRAGLRAGLRTGFGFRFGFRFGFGTPLRNLLQRIYRTLIDRLNTKGIEIGLGSDRTGIVKWGL
jgi:hypothetical protein